MKRCLKWLITKYLDIGKCFCYVNKSNILRSAIITFVEPFALFVAKTAF